MRIVIKVGTSTLTHSTGKLNIRRVELLCKVMSDLKNAGHELVLVSSGAIAMGVGKLNLLHKMLTDVANKHLPADEKLTTFIYTRLDAIKALVFRNGTLRATFFRDIWRVEKVRKEFDLKEVEIIKGILDDGVKEGVFLVPDTSITASVLHYALKGLEVPYIRGVMGDNIAQRLKRRDNVMNLIFNGIKIKRPENVY